MEEKKFNITIDRTKVNTLQWEQFVNEQENGSFFQSPGFYDFIKHIKGYKAINIFAFNSENKLVGVLCGVIQKESQGLKSFFSSRLIIWGGPLVYNEETEICRALLEKLVAIYSQKTIFMEFRNSFDNSKFKTIFISNGFQYNPHLNVLLNINESKTDEIIAKMTYNRRREIKLSLKEGAEYCLAKGIEEVKELYEILFDLYKNKVKLPLPDISFFFSIFHSNHGKVFLVKHNDIIIGGAFCVYLQKGTINTFYYCGKKQANSKIFPTHIAILAVINFAIENQLKVVDFMGAGKPDKKYGVRDYKMQFGGQLVEYGRYVRINRPLLYKIGKLGLNILGRLKKV